MTYATPLTHASLADHPPPRGPTLADFGVRLSRQLMGDVRALSRVLARHVAGDDRNIDEAILAELPTRRASAKRRAIRQRLEREARR